MGLRTQLKTDLVDMFATMGETATFTPATGAAVTCYVLLSIAIGRLFTIIPMRVRTLFVMWIWAALLT